MSLSKFSAWNQTAPLYNSVRNKKNKTMKKKILPANIQIQGIRKLTDDDLANLISSGSELSEKLLRNRLEISFDNAFDLEHENIDEKTKEMSIWLKENTSGLYHVDFDNLFEYDTIISFELDSDMVHFQLRFAGKS